MATLIVGALVVALVVLPTFNAWGAGIAGALAAVAIVVGCGVSVAGLSRSAIPWFVHPLFGVGLGMIVGGVVAVLAAALAQGRPPKTGTARPPDEK